jgi:hypothetical protein
MTLDADSLGSNPTINFDLFTFTLTGINLTTPIRFCQGNNCCLPTLSG